MKTLSLDSFIKFEGNPSGITCKLETLSRVSRKLSSEESETGGGRRGVGVWREGSLRF